MNLMFAYVKSRFLGHLRSHAIYYFTNVHILQLQLCCIFSSRRSLVCWLIRCEITNQASDQITKHSSSNNSEIKLPCEVFLSFEFDFKLVPQLMYIINTRIT